MQKKCETTARGAWDVSERRVRQRQRACPSEMTVRDAYDGSDGCRKKREVRAMGTHGMRDDDEGCGG